MESNDLEALVLDIVREARKLKDAHTTEISAPVNYACVFAQSKDEYDSLIQAVQQVGTVVQETKAGPVFRISPLNTVSGTLKLLKIRKPDPTRPERGDADFTVSDYSAFKKACLEKSGFRLIERKTMEIIELIDPIFNVRAYFSHPTLGQVLGVP